MEIYSYDNGWNTLMNCIYATLAIVFAVALVFAFVRLILPLFSAKRNGEKTPVILKVLLIILLSIPLIGCVGLSNLFFESIAYENDMKNGKAQVLVGEVELLSYQKIATRGDGFYYVVELRIGDQTISPLNGFYEEHLAHFQNGEKMSMSIEYGIQGDALYVWSIKTVD